MKNKVSAALAALLLLAFDMPQVTASQGVEIRQGYRYFQVKGRDPLSLLRDFQKKAPIKGTKDNVTLGVARIRIKPSYKLAQSGDRCRVKEHNVVVDTRIFLPQWRDYGRVSPAARAWWDNFAANIREHEKVHGKIADKYARKISFQLKNAGSAATCKQLEVRVIQKANKLLIAHDRAQAAFDRRDRNAFLRRIR